MKTPTLSLSFLATLFLAGCQTPVSLEQAQVLASEKFESRAQRAVGASAVVVRHGEVLWRSTTGWADRDTKTPVSEVTQFRMYSLVKPMTVTVALALEAQDQLDPDATLGSLMPDLPSDRIRNQVTARMLATHTSGIRHYANAAEALGDRHCESVSDALAIFSRDPLVLEPGERGYSSWGYVLLGRVLELAGEQPFDALLAEQVLGPLNMSGTFHDDPRQSLPNRAASYHMEADAHVPSPSIDNSCKWGAGGYVSTATDMGRFASALANASGPISPEIQRAIFRGDERYRAVGWAEGGMGYLVADAPSGIAVVILTNTLDRRLGEGLNKLVDELVELFARVPVGEGAG